MNKLTAERCRDRIASLKRNQRVFGLAMDSELYLAALEIALPVLEQQEKGGNDWIEWDGGECPVPPKTIVIVRYRKGKEEAPGEAGGYFWSHGRGIRATVDIIAYRVVEQERERGEEE